MYVHSGGQARWTPSINYFPATVCTYYSSSDVNPDMMYNTLGLGPYPVEEYPSSTWQENSLFSLWATEVKAEEIFTLYY